MAQINLRGTKYETAKGPSSLFEPYCTEMEQRQLKWIDWLLKLIVLLAILGSVDEVSSTYSLGNYFFPSLNIYT